MINRHYLNFIRRQNCHSHSRAFQGALTAAIIMGLVYLSLFLAIKGCTEPQTALKEGDSGEMTRHEMAELGIIRLTKAEVDQMIDRGSYDH